jgi:hypothetical protein
MASKTKKPEQKESGSAELVRRFKENPLLFGGTVLILIIVIIAFVLVPAIPDIGRMDDVDLTFGYYNGAPISYIPDNYFANALAQAELMDRFSGGDSTDDLQRTMRLWETAFMQTLVHLAVLEEMKTAGYSAPPDEIDKQVASLPDFQEEGRFSAAKYRRMDKSRILTLWNRARDDYTRDQYLKDVNGLLVSSLEKEFIGSLISPKRNFDLAVFPRTDYPDSEIAAFAASTSAPFKLVHLSRITISTSEKEARQLLESIQSGRTSFEDSARNQSQDMYKEQGGDLGIKMAWEIYRDIPDQAEREAVLSLPRGEFSPVVKVPSSDSSPNSWAFFRAEEDPRTADFSIAENAEKARSYMRQFEGGRMENWLVVQAEQFISQARESGFAEAAADREMELRRFGPINLNYGNVSLFNGSLDSSVPEFNAAVTNENFWKAAFSTPLNSPSVPFTLGESVVVLIPVEELPEDDTDQGIPDWYAANWMRIAMDRELREAFSSSKKFENNFGTVFFENFFLNQF